MLLERSGFLVLKEQRPDMIVVGLLNSVQEIDTSFFVDFLVFCCSGRSKPGGRISDFG